MATNTATYPPLAHTRAHGYIHTLPTPCTDPSCPHAHTGTHTHNRPMLTQAGLTHTHGFTCTLPIMQTHAFHLSPPHTHTNAHISCRLCSHSVVATYSGHKPSHPQGAGGRDKW